MESEDFRESEDLVEILEPVLPDTFTRRSLSKWLHGYLTPGHIANLNSQGLGPKYVRVGRNAVYTKSSFLKWLKAYLSKTAAGNPPRRIRPEV